MVFLYERVCLTFFKRELQMTTQEVACAGAPSHESVNWHSIDWARSELEVLIAELEQTTDAVVGTATVGPIETATDDEAAGPARS